MSLHSGSGRNIRLDQNFPVFCARVCKKVWIFIFKCHFSSIVKTEYSMTSFVSTFHDFCMKKWNLGPQVQQQFWKSKNGIYTCLYMLAYVKKSEKFNASVKSTISFGFVALNAKSPHQSRNGFCMIYFTSPKSNEEFKTPQCH